MSVIYPNEECKVLAEIKELIDGIEPSGSASGFEGKLIIQNNRNSSYGIILNFYDNTYGILPLTVTTSANASKELESVALINGKIVIRSTVTAAKTSVTNSKEYEVQTVTIAGAATYYIFITPKADNSDITVAFSA